MNQQALSYRTHQTAGQCVHGPQVACHRQMIQTIRPALIACSPSAGSAAVALRACSGSNLTPHTPSARRNDEHYPKELLKTIRHYLRVDENLDGERNVDERVDGGAGIRAGEGWRRGNTDVQ